MTVVDGPPRLVRDARDLAQTLLAGLPQRWRHTVGVARRAEAISPAVDSAHDAELLIAAAWLHDIGYACPLHATGFHPLDGARYLLAHRWPMSVAALVAHHSDADDIAFIRGLARDLADFPDPPVVIADALTYADQTVGPDGTSMMFTRRVRDMLARHGPDSPNAAAHPRREPVLRAAVTRVERRLATFGFTSYA